MATLGLGSTGCLRFWGRGQAGGAYNTADRQNQSGPMVGTDIAFTPKFIPFLAPNKPLPIAIHVSGEAIVAPERRSLALGTGLAYTTPPRPVSPYFILGTTAHGDTIAGTYSFGNFSPYAELGLMTPLRRPNPDEDPNGFIFTLGLGAYSFINYFAGTDKLFDGFITLRLGIGWEQN